MKDGKLYSGGGLRGLFNNMVGGSIQSGNTIGAALPVVYQFAGDLINVLSGKVSKETKLAVIMTEATQYDMETVVYHQVKVAQDLLIDLGAVQVKIGQLQ